MNTAQIDQQIAAVQRQRRDAELAETARKNAANENQRQIDHADMQLAALERQKATAAFDEAVQYNVKLLNQNATACARLTAALNTAAKAFRDNIGNLPADVLETFTTQQRHADNAIGLKLQSSGVLANAQDSSTVAHFADDVVRQASAKLPNAMGMYATLAGWIAQAQTDHERRLRTGIAYVIAGEEITPPKGFNAEQANNIEVNTRRDAGISARR